MLPLLAPLGCLILSKGSYQWALLTLCGFGVLRHLLQCFKKSLPVFQVGQLITCVTPFDRLSTSSCSHALHVQMWLQAIAIILPRVRDQYGVSNNMIGALSSSTFAGMFLGAFVWGTCMHLDTCPLVPCPLMPCFVLACRLRRLRESNGIQPHFNSHSTYRLHCNACTILYPAMRCHVLPWDSSGGACPTYPAYPAYIHLFNHLTNSRPCNRGACLLTRHWHWRHCHDRSATY